MTEIRLSELADLIGGRIDSSEDPLIGGAGGLENARPGDITFLNDERRRDELATTRAAAVILRPDIPVELPAIRVDEPYRAFAQVLARFETPPERLFPPGIHASAVIAETAELGPDVAVGPNTVIGDGVRLGAECRIGAGVVIEPGAVLGEKCVLHARAFVGHDCRLGNAVTLHPGAVIGADGFGYLPGPEGMIKIPQIGCVVLGDRVEIGANACVDRATTGETVVGRGTKIDNLVQIAHNVAIGEHCAVSAQTGLSGSCRIGNGVTMGGQVGVGDHLKIGDGAKLAGQSGVIRDIEAGQTVFGYPAQDFKRAFRRFAVYRKLPELLARIRKLEQAAQTDSTSGEE